MRHYVSQSPTGRRLRAAGLMLSVLFLGGLLPSASTLAADAAPASGKSADRGDQKMVTTNILARIYQSGNGRLARGDAAGAIRAFQIVRDTAPQLAESNYALGLATMLADFSKREQALPWLAQANGTDPGNPFGAVIAVLADPQSSMLRPDGALYVTAAAAERLRNAAQLLGNYPAAPNAKYAISFLNSAESTGDKNFPARFANFSRMVGQNGTVRLPNIATDVVFGQLFQLRVSEARFSPYEQNLVARLQDGLKSLEANQDNLSRIRSRIQQLRTRLDTNDPTERMVAMASLDKLLSDLDDIIVGNETTVASLRVIVDNVGVDQALTQKKQEVQQEEVKLVALRNTGKALTLELNQKKAAVTEAERSRLTKIKEVDDAQRKLNDLEKRLGSAETQLSTSSQTTAQAEQAMRQRNEQLAQLAAREAALRKQQAAVEQLESTRQQQGAAADQLSRLRADIQQAEASKQGNLAALRQQESSLSAKLATLQRDVSAGETARQQADQVRQELATLQSRKGSLETDMRGEEARLAGLRAERDGLQQQVEAMRRDQEKQVAERARLAQFTKEVNFGRYFALVIGNNDYREWPKLKTAVADATDVADILEKKYGFKVRLLSNAKRDDIVNAFDDYINELGPNDNLLVYYAGHGILDSNNSGYWVPVDGDAYVPGQTLRTRNLVRHEDVISTIGKLHAKQVLVIADSCFSGGLAAIAAAALPPPRSSNVQVAALSTRGFRLVEKDGNNVPIAALQGTVASADKPDELIAMEHWASRAARIVLTSGGNEPVIDQLKAGDRHSVFAQALLTSLQLNKGLLKSIELTNAVQDQVIGKLGGTAAKRTVGATGGSAAAPTPSFSNLSGYNGEFLFVARN